MKFRSISIHALRTAHINKLLNGNEMTMGWMELGARFLSIFMSGQKTEAEEIMYSSMGCMRKKGQ